MPEKDIAMLKPPANTGNIWNLKHREGIWREPLIGGREIILFVGASRSHSFSIEGD